MPPVIAVGFDSVLDVWITFPTLKDFKSFADGYARAASKLLKHGYELVAAGKGEEVPVDGKILAPRELLKRAREAGAKIRYALGGNGALEATTLGALGAKVVFIGGFSPAGLAEMLPSERKRFKKADLSFALASKRGSVSYVLQARNTNRYILCDGRGKRIEHLRHYVKKLPSTIEGVLDKYRKLDVVNLVGLHGLFANGIRNGDLRLVENVVNKIRGATGAPLFTDAGGLEAFSRKERRLLGRVYSMFDILSVNEEEVLHISRALGSQAKDEFEAVRAISKSSPSLSTVWLHSTHYQASLSTRYEETQLKMAQAMAAAAGAYRVERGAFPSSRALTRIVKTANYSERGLSTVTAAKNRYGSKIDGATLAVTPCYKIKSFASTVGAGDIAAAAYTYTLAKKD